MQMCMCSMRGACTRGMYGWCKYSLCTALRNVYVRDVHVLAMRTCDECTRGMYGYCRYSLYTALRNVYVRDVFVLTMRTCGEYTRGYRYSLRTALRDVFVLAMRMWYVRECMFSTWYFVYGMGCNGLYTVCAMYVRECVGSVCAECTCGMCVRDVQYSLCIRREKDNHYEHV